MRGWGSRLELRQRNARYKWPGGFHAERCLGGTDDHGAQVLASQRSEQYRTERSSLGICLAG